MEEDKRGRELTMLLEQAADGLPGALRAFFYSLLNSEVYVPLVEENPPVLGPQILGETVPEDQGFATVYHEGEEFVPIFTEKEFVDHWAGGEQPCVKKKFSALLWLIGDDTWLYLNANQEVGKEITPWEIALLKKGEDAIGDLVAAQSEETSEELEVRSDPDLYPDLKRDLLSVLEVCPDLDEAFLVAVKQADTQTEYPMLGLRYQRKVKKETKSYIREEIEEMRLDSPKFSGLVIADDLEAPASAHEAFFSDAKPFYLSPRAAKGGPPKTFSSRMRALIGLPEETPQGKPAEKPPERPDGEGAQEPADGDED